MKRLFAWVAGAAGGLAAFRALHRALRGRRPVADTGADARAAELKEKLQEARTVADDREAFGAGPGVDDAAPVDEAEPLDPAARRAQVHEHGRAALDEMRGDQAGS